MINNVSNPWHWRIATSEAGLATGSFFVNKLPAPSTCFYQKTTVENPQSDGLQAVHGYQQTTLLWDVLNGYQYKTLKDVITLQSQAKSTIYLTIDRGDGSHSNPDWIDVFGYPYIQIAQSQEGPLIGRYAGGSPDFRSVKLFLNNLTIRNDPSLYTTP